MEYYGQSIKPKTDFCKDNAVFKGRCLRSEYRAELMEHFVVFSKNRISAVKTKRNFIF